MRRNKRQVTSNKKKVAVVFVAVGVVLVGLGLLFEVKLGPSRWVRQWQSKTVKVAAPEQVTYEELAGQVIPKSGKTVLVEWGNMGQKLVQAGAIDMVKFKKIFPELTEEQRQILEGDDLHQITFGAKNIDFWTDVLWALGLTQKSKVLSEGPMQQNAKSTPLQNYASTAGWTLGRKTAMQLYNSTKWSN